MTTLHKKWIWALAAVLALAVLYDWNYIAATARYYLFPPKQDMATEQSQAPQMAPDTLEIRSLGISAPVVYESEKSEAAFQKALQRGVVHFPGTANPGQLGNCYIFGHSSDYVWSAGAYKQVFALLPKIKIGDEIKISDGAGKVFAYKVARTLVVAPSDVSVLSQYENKKYLLTLQTSYPLGTALKRFIVVAEMQ